MNDFSDDDTRRLLGYLGVALVAGGATVTDAEADVKLVGRHLGYPNVQVSALPTTVMLSLTSGGPASIERNEGPFRLDQSYAAAEVRQQLMAGRLTVAQAVARLAQIRRKPHTYGVWASYWGNMLVALGICLVMQPGWTNVALVAGCSLLVTLLTRLSGRHALLAALLPVVATLAVSLIILWCTQQGWIDGPLRTLICPVAILLPGALLSTAMAELATGAMVSGGARAAFGLVQLLLAALGTVSAALLLGFPSSQLTNWRIDELGWWAAPLGVAAIAFGICWSEALPMRMLTYVAPVLVATYVAQANGQHHWPTVPVGAFAGGAIASFLASWIETRFDVPRLIVFLPSFWLLVPGTLGLLGITSVGLGTGQTQSLVAVLVLVAAIALGLLVGTAFSLPVRRLASLRLRLAAPRPGRSAPSSSRAVHGRSGRRQ